MRRSIPRPAVENEASAIIEELKQKQIEKRVLAYITKVIRNSPLNYCCVSQDKMRKAITDRKGNGKRKGFRKQAIADACRNLARRGELIRIAVNNRNRRNPKYYYFLPDAELHGNPNKSLFSRKEDNEKVNPNFTDERKISDEVGKAFEEAEINFSEVGSWNDFGRLELMKKYLDAGLMLTPLIEKGKIPPAGWDIPKLRSLSKTELLDFFAANPNLNVGCWLPEKFVVVDADNLDEFYQLTSGETWDTLTATSGREEGGLHFWFRHCGTIESVIGIRPHLDYLAQGRLVVLPPSVHKSGAVYRWNNLTAPIEAPQLIQDLFDTREKKVEQRAVELADNYQYGRSRLPSNNAVFEKGKRYPKLFGIGRGLRWRLSAEQVATELVAINQQCCRPPLDDKRMRKLVLDVLYGVNRKEFTRV